MRKLLQTEADEADSLPLGVFAHVQEGQEELRRLLLQKLQCSDLLSQSDVFLETNVNFGGASGIVTSMALIVGFSAAGASLPPIIAGLLIVGVADNVTDSLSIHIYQESDRLKARPAFLATLSNFATRLAIALTFVLIVFVFPGAYALFASLARGTFPAYWANMARCTAARC